MELSGMFYHDFVALDVGDPEITTNSIWQDIMSREKWSKSDDISHIALHQVLTVYSRESIFQRHPLFDGLCKNKMPQ